MAAEQWEYLLFYHYSSIQPKQSGKKRKTLQSFQSHFTMSLETTRWSFGDLRDDRFWPLPPTSLHITLGPKNVLFFIFLGILSNPNIY